MVKSRRIVLLFDERAKEIPPQTIRVDGHFFNRYAKKGKPHDGEQKVDDCENANSLRFFIHDSNYNINLILILLGIEIFSKQNYMIEKSFVEQKQDNFRIEIRRKQIDEEFQKKRYELLSMKLAQQQRQIQQQLSTPQQKQQFVNSIAICFVGNPSLEWEKPLRKLLISAKQFQNQGELWLKSGVIGSMVALFKQEFANLGLAPLAAEVLADIIYYNKQKSGRFLTAILELQFLEDLIELCNNMEVSAYHYFMLFTEMMDQSYPIRDICVNRGLLQVLFRKLKNPCMEDQMNQLQAGFNLAVRLVKTYYFHTYEKQPKTSVLAVFINVYDESLETYGQHENLLRIIFKGISCVLQTNIEFLIKNAFNSKNTVKFLLNHFRSKDLQIRQSCIKSICQFTACKNHEFTKELVYLKLLDMIHDVGKFEKASKTIALLCISVGNIIMNSNQEAEEVIRHPVFGQFILSHLHQSKTFIIRKQALTCVRNMIEKNRLTFNDILIKQFNCLQALILCFNAHDANIHSTVLACLKQLIIFYENVYSEKKNNKVVDMLESIYNFSNVLNQLLDKSMNKLVIARCNQLFQLIHTS